MKTNYIFKNAFSLAFFMFVFLSSGTAYADAVVVNGVAYNVVNGAAEVAAKPDGTKYTGIVTIPANVTISGTSYAVKKIGANSMREAPELTNVIIPEGLEVIGNSCFAFCKGLTNIVLPSTVNSIEDWAFYDCSGLQSINIPNGVPAITEHTFQQTGLKSITLPASVKSLKVCAFQNATNLASINLENVTEIVAWALYGTAITTANISNVFTIGSEAFKLCPNLASVVLNNVTSVGSWSFNGCTKLTSVNLGNAETLEAGAFSGCSALTTLTIPSSVIFIDAYALERAGITKIYASWPNPAATVFIDANAFGAGDGLTNFTWMVPENLLDVYGTEFMGHQVLVTDISGLKIIDLKDANAYYSKGNLSLKGFEGYNVSIVSVDGRTVKHFMANDSNMQVSISLASGIYMINASNGNNRAVAKFMVK